MRTTFHVRQPYADIFSWCAREFQCNSPVRPEKFIRKMKMNQGSIGRITGLGMDEEGLERKNPVIVALGDSVTAGHFETLIGYTKEEAAVFQKRAEESLAKGGGMIPVEITDCRESYLEKFRLRLIDRYELTSVSAINAGIAGDHLIQMSARAQRDVIRYQPDLVLINGSLNWSAELGTAEEYKRILKALVERIRTETDADIVLLTPNGAVANTIGGLEGGPEPDTIDRVRKIRELAAEEQVCLADVYAVWEAARDAGCPWVELLANKTNHPAVEGHEVYADVLMKLFEQD